MMMNYHNSVQFTESEWSCSDQWSLFTWWPALDTDQELLQCLQSQGHHWLLTTDWGEQNHAGLECDSLVEMSCLIPRMGYTLLLLVQTPIKYCVDESHRSELRPAVVNVSLQWRMWSADWLQHCSNNIPILSSSKYGELGEWGDWDKLNRFVHFYNCQTLIDGDKN